MEQQSVFSLLLSLFQTAPVLQLPNVGRPFVIMTDASLIASRGVLMQWDGNGDLHPCAYISQMLSPAERNYDIYDRSCSPSFMLLSTGAIICRGPLTPSPYSLITRI